MTTEIEVLDPLPKRVPKNGGARERSGPKSRETRDEIKKAIEEAGEYIDYAKARAKKETFQAHKAELDYKIQIGEYVSRDSVRDASARAMSAIAQTLRSIPDNLERKLGIAPEIAEEVGRLIDDALNDLADELERMHEYGA